jgi:hypothetical protein
MTEQQIADSLTEAQRKEWLSLEWTGANYEPPMRFRKKFSQLGMTDPYYEDAVTILGHNVRVILEQSK